MISQDALAFCSYEKVAHDLYDILKDCAAIAKYLIPAKYDPRYNFSVRHNTLYF